MWFLHKVWKVMERLQAAYCKRLGCTYKCGCGHTAKWKTILTIEGKEGVYVLPRKAPEYCPQCFASAVIRCAWCGESIIPGDAITLYTPRVGSRIPEHAVVYKQDPHVQLVGCMRWDCSETGADRAGFWVMPGKVQRVMSPIEMLLASGGDVMIFNNLHDPNAAIPIPD